MPAPASSGLRLALAQRFYFDSQRGDHSRADQPHRPPLGRAARRLRRDSAAATASTPASSTRSATTAFRASASAGATGPGDRRLLNAGVRYQSREYAQWGTSWQWPMSARWSSLGKINYSFLQERNDPATGQLVDVQAGSGGGPAGLRIRGRLLGDPLRRATFRDGGGSRYHRLLPPGRPARAWTGSGRTPLVYWSGTSRVTAFRITGRRLHRAFTVTSDVPNIVDRVMAAMAAVISRRDAAAIAPAARPAQRPRASRSTASSRS